MHQDLARPSRAKLSHGRRGLSDDEVYIGRGSRKFSLGPSLWANPFAIGRDGTREEVIQRYAAHLEASPDLIERLPELAGRTLLCHCGLREKCHGDAIIRAFVERHADAASAAIMPPTLAPA